MTVKIGISGMGRIGRMALRIALQDPGVEVVAINATSDITTLAHLLRYDSTHGRWDVVIQARDDELIIDGHSITVLKERNPLLLPWGALGAEVVLEATGQFTSYKAAAQHLEGGAKKVVLSTAAKDDMLTIVYGVNHSMYDSAVHDVISGASCTTNSLSPIVHFALPDHHRAVQVYHFKSGSHGGGSGEIRCIFVAFTCPSRCRDGRRFCHSRQIQGQVSHHDHSFPL